MVLGYVNTGRTGREKNIVFDGPSMMGKLTTLLFVLLES